MPPMGMEEMRREMERMLGARRAKPLMPRLLDADRLTERERNALRGAAERQAQEGLLILERGARQLLKARRAGDDRAIERAVERLQEGAALWERGAAVQHGLSSSPAPPSKTAIRWFKSQMNLDAQLPSIAGPAPWGLSWVHFGVMAVLGLFATVAAALYLYKVQRSLSFLSRLTKGNTRR